MPTKNSYIPSRRPNVSKRNDLKSQYPSCTCFHTFYIDAQAELRPHTAKTVDEIEVDVIKTQALPAIT
jgi:hypothetical protein